MSYKKVFLDANVILDIYDENRPFHQKSSEAISILLEQKDVELFTSCDIVTTLYYVLSKRGKREALDSILDVNELCNVIEFANQEIKESCQLMKNNQNFTDLEDTIQYVMAKKVHCDLILSNDKGFVSEGILLMGSGEFIE
ncbi:MAG TPA: PIN domain-containing protein [Campylobacterales bacterium]|nr:PIN domain-containing protein [Campylobacterales bacterium]HHS93502.1 PIN domain-containing protein [Campylobacterales bacterium]